MHLAVWVILWPFVIIWCSLLLLVTAKSLKINEGKCEWANQFFCMEGMVDNISGKSRKNLIWMEMEWISARSRTQISGKLFGKFFVQILEPPSRAFFKVLVFSSFSGPALFQISFLLKFFSFSVLNSAEQAAEKYSENFFFLLHKYFFLLRKFSFLLSNVFFELSKLFFLLHNFLFSVE